MNRNAFDDREGESGDGDFILQLLDSFARPDIADGNVVESADDSCYSRNLSDVFKGD